MSLALWLGLARDAAAILALIFMGLTAALFWSGEDGIAGGLAASVAVMAAAGLATLAFYGLLSAATGLSMTPIGLALAALLLIGAFFGAHVYGARGLWVAGLSMVGAALAWGLLFVFSLRLGSALGPAAPMVAFLALTLLSAAALGAAARAAKPGTSLAVAEASAARPAGVMTAATRLLGAPPPWFDCAYAALGGAAADPAGCRLTPPAVASAPAWAESAPAPSLAPTERRGPRLTASSRAEDPITPPRALGAPGAPDAPLTPASDAPRFDPAPSVPAAEPDAPDGLTPPRNADRPAAPAAAEPAPPEAPPAEAVEIAEAPEEASPQRDPAAPARVAPPRQPGAPRLEPRIAEGRPASAVAAFLPEDAAPPRSPDAAATPGRFSGDADRTLSAFVCFPMTSVAADRLCPDQRFGVEDLEIAWRLPGGAARQNPAGVECYVDPEAPLHATVMAHLTGDLAGMMPRGPGLETRGDAARLRKAEAVYEAATRLLSAARAEGGEGAAETRLSLYLSGGSSLRGPWAEQSFGPERADRLFDLASISQSLTMLRRLREETQALRKTSVGPDLAAAIQEMIADRPSAPASARGAPPRDVVLLIVDSLSVETLSEAVAARLGGLLAEAGLTAMTVEIGPAGVTPAMTRLAEASGGAAASAADAEGLFHALAAALDKARRFCAVRVVGPERFFTEGAVEISLRRRRTDGCALEQIATLSCDGLVLKERIDPNVAE